MAKVSLRNYNREIESMIEHGQRLDEALAHCLHILRTFSKHIETYRLLGKTYLEGKRYNEAVDIFRRVLVAVPDDFVSHVGMSIISDDQGKLDEAIWYMERAFEVQPSNAAIQGELRRLFGRRDGAEPPKIRLTRGALAHMYMQGELYVQAISEIRAVLGNDAQRTDMQVLLARAYFRDKQKTEATDICNQLLKRSPYCFDANRIMVEILAGPQSAGSTDVYRRRVIELDPYAAFAKESIFSLEEVPEAAVSLERLEYTGQALDIGKSWGGTLGIGLEADSTSMDSGAKQPDWLKAADTTLASSRQPSVTSNISQSSSPQRPSEIPDFLRPPSSPASSVAPMAEQAGSASSALQADLPDWVKAMAPADEGEFASQPQPSSSRLTGFGKQRDDVPPVASASDSDTPDWLKELGSQELDEPLRTSKTQSDSDWLRNLDEKPVSGGKSATAASGPLDWAKMNEEPPPVSQPSAVFQPAAGQTKSTPTPPSASKRSLPAEVDPSAQPTQVGPDPAAYLGGLGTSPKEQDDAMAWLESLASKHGAKPEELVTDPRARSDVAPDWVDKAMEIGEQAPAHPVPEQDNTGIWLKNLDSTKIGLPAPMQDSPPPAQKNLSDWRSGLTGGDDFAGLAADKDSEETPDWLSGLGATPDQPLTVEHTPDWLDPDLGQGPQAGSAVPQEFSFGSTSTADLPDWLAGLDKEEEGIPSSPATGGDVPSWFQGDAQPHAAEPTLPTDWQPVESKTMSDQSPVPVLDFSFDESDSPKKAATKIEKKAATQVPSSPKQAAGLPKITDASLANAQSELGIGNIAASLEIYGKLIRKGKFQKEIIEDLREALYRYPVEVPIWQALGDAYMRANRLQEALDAYTKAEELLR
jgi:tetratricopeptide (TPR) repeat protein